MSYGHPSGHSCTCFCLATLLAFELSASLRFGRRVLVALLGALVAGLVAFSRVFLAKHYLSNVVYGSFLGIWMSFAFFFTVKVRLESFDLSFKACVLTSMTLLVLIFAQYAFLSYLIEEKEFNDASWLNNLKAHGCPFDSRVAFHRQTLGPISESVCLPFALFAFKFGSKPAA